ncbi:methionine synthase reductase [Musca vetustissima]|uniref:methionine synthase reductase n=1 Tax=Musca vetustissima TaxID=27455 RepID=UPI002AB73522|nr:methionine synthase reductase [Musca vetustissima]
MAAPINIHDFILKSYTEAKALSDSNLELTYGEEHVLPTTKEHGQQKCPALIYPFAASPLFEVPIKGSKLLLESNADENINKSITEITLNVADTGITWQPGDTIAILPRNPRKEVESLLYALDLSDKADLTCHIKVSPLCTKKTVKVPAHIPTTSTPRELLRDCINIRGVLKKQLLSSLANYCSDNDEVQFLKSLSSKEASSQYNDLIMEKGFTLLDILEVCHSCRPPLALLIEHLPRLLPRPYSIANSQLENAKEIQIIFSTLCDKPGVTTQFLMDKLQEEHPSIVMYLRQSNAFRYTTEEDFEKNQILIAIGTAMAPFLGFLQHKEHLSKQETKAAGGQTWLFVGATSQEAILHRDQLLNWQDKNVLNKFVEAYSRSSASDYKYVQDALHHHGDSIVELLSNPNTALYLCADGGEISKSIEKCLLEIFQEKLQISETEATELLKDYKAKGKYRLDVWL